MNDEVDETVVRPAGGGADGGDGDETVIRPVPTAVGAGTAGEPAVRAADDAGDQTVLRPVADGVAASASEPTHLRDGADETVIRPRAGAAVPDATHVREDGGDHTVLRPVRDAGADEHTHLRTDADVDETSIVGDDDGGTRLRTGARTAASIEETHVRGPGTVRRAPSPDGADAGSVPSGEPGDGPSAPLQRIWEHPRRVLPLTAEEFASRSAARDQLLSQLPPTGVSYRPDAGPQSSNQRAAAKKARAWLIGSAVVFVAALAGLIAIIVSL